MLKLVDIQCGTQNVLNGVNTYNDVVSCSTLAPEC